MPLRRNRRPTIRQWMEEYNRLAIMAQARGIRVRTYANLRVANSEAQLRVQQLAQRLQTTSALVEAAPPLQMGTVVREARTPASYAPAVTSAIDDLGTGMDIDDFFFGVELEFYANHQWSQNEVATRLRDNANGLDIRAEGYTHATRSHWKVVSDASLMMHCPPGKTGHELVSPRLKGADGLEQLAKACDALVAIGATVTRGSGMHVHVGYKHSNDNPDFVKQLVANYCDNERHIDSILAPSRRANNNTYCRSLTPAEKEQVARGTTMSQVCSRDQLQRFRKINLTSYWRHKTVEFRQHQGTTDKVKASAWVRFCLRMVASAAKRSGVAAPDGQGQTDLLAFLTSIDCNADEVGFFASRYAHFHGGAEAEA